RFDNEIELPHLKMTVSDHQDNAFGIQWQRYWDDAPYPELVKQVPHVAFEVDDLEQALAGHKILIAPNSPSPGLTVAFIEVNGAPVELMQYDKITKPRRGPVGAGVAHSARAKRKAQLG
ncbi:VOC family protein, partial [Chromobacterium amazonense]|uniref:VOC family protein n=1 Tax=Chromobacterium amazonense TaxID=1382803 RepID=UPI001CB89CD0